MGILRSVFALSEQGVKGLLKGILFSALADINLMLPVGLTVLLLKELIGIGLWCMDWRMALALLWAAPVAVLIMAGSRRLQDRFGRKSISAKLACADGIQECLEAVREIKACNQDERYLRELDDKLARAEAAAVRLEATTGSFVAVSHMVLRLGMVSVILVGGELLATGRADLMTYLIFLMAASRVYDPLSWETSGWARGERPTGKCWQRPRPHSATASSAGCRRAILRSSAKTARDSPAASAGGSP